MCEGVLEYWREREGEPIDLSKLFVRYAMHMAENRGIDKVRGEGSPWRCLMNLNVRHGDCLAPAEYEHPHEIKKEYPPPSPAIS